VGCRHHLYLDVNPTTGAIKLNYPGKDVDEIGPTCSLDVAEKAGGLSLREVADHMQITLERVRQIEVSAEHKVKANLNQLPRG